MEYSSAESRHADVFRSGSIVSRVIIKRVTVACFNVFIPATIQSFTERAEQQARTIQNFPECSRSHIQWVTLLGICSNIELSITPPPQCRSTGQRKHPTDQLPPNVLGLFHCKDNHSFWFHPPWFSELWLHKHECRYRIWCKNRVCTVLKQL